MISDKPWRENVVEAATYDAFYCCFDAATPTDPDPTTSYERDYRPLERRIAKVLKEHAIPADAVSFFDSWSPNRTRHVDLPTALVTSQMVHDLHGLLRRKYDRWRIELRLVRDLESCDEEGMIALWKGWVLCYGTGREVIREVSKRAIS